MRIRKTLAKALGQTNPESAAPSEDWIPPFCFNTLVDGSSSSYCELNQSPWDVYPNHRFFRTTFKCFESVTPPDHQPKEEHEDKSHEISEHEKDILEIVPTMKIAEEKPPFSRRVNAQSLSRKGRATEMKDNNEIILCKKHDGKNWFCKREAKLPRYYCEYHLAKSQSYYRNTSSGSKASDSKKQKNKTTENFDSEYYYYGTVAPSRGKRHHARNVDDGSNVIHVDEEKMDKIDVLDEEKEDGVEVQDHKAVYCSSNDEETVKTGIKRARKLSKFRSVNSFSEMEPKSSADGENE